MFGLGWFGIMEVCIPKPQGEGPGFHFATQGSMLGPYSSSVIPKKSILVCGALDKSCMCLFFALWGTWGFHWDTLGFHLCTVGAPLGPFGHHFGTLGSHLGIIWAPLDSIWGPRGPFLCLFQTLGRGPGPLWTLLGKSLEKGTQHDRKRYHKWRQT